jgi:hypothetical protein
MLLKIFVPLSIFILILKQYCVLDFLAPYFAPMMSFMGRRTGIGLQICRKEKYLYNADMDAK